MPKISCHLWAFLMAIQFYLTDVGRTAALNADILGLDLNIKYIAVGSGKYNAATAAATKTALTTELERYLVNGGEIEPTTKTLRFTVSLNSGITADIFEIGLFDENNVLFAVASVTGAIPLVKLINEVNTIITFGFTLDDVDNITLMLDVNSPLAVTLMNQHTAHEHPHAQYKRINDDTERLKVANATDPKDAVNKEQLDAEATTRSNADTALQNSKAALAGSSTQQFSVADGSTQYHAVNKGQLDAEATARANADTNLQTAINGKANTAGSSTQTFSVAAATANDHAVRKDQFDAKTGIATDTTAGIVEKATQAEMNAGTANVWPDAATILSGFDSQGQSMDLPSFLGNYGIRWGAATQVSAGEGTVSVVYSKPFPNDTLFTTAIIENPAATSSGENDVWAQLVSSDRFGASFYVQSTATLALVKSIRWFAIGR